MLLSVCLYRWLSTKVLNGLSIANGTSYLSKRFIQMVIYNPATSISAYPRVMTTIHARILDGMPLVRKWWTRR